MNITEHQQNTTIQYCFPDNNSSCRKEVRAGSASVVVFIVLSCVSVFTVFLNLLVIISISHFKQLHTPTNLLILSLAVADLLVGLIIMPVRIMDFIDSCWYLGKTVCTLFPVIDYVTVSASVSSLVLIAVDRYIAVNDPLLYPTRITVCKTSLFIIIAWSWSVFYNLMLMYFNNHLLHSQISDGCYGECVLVMKYSWVIADIVVSFLFPCVIILILYSIIFKVARRQAKAVKAVKNSATNNHGAKVSSSSETKAAKTLAIVIFLYLACWIPFTVGPLSADEIISSSLVVSVVNWFLYINSSVNPLIYAIFYPWFKTSVRYIVTCQIFESSSSSFNLIPERF
ncbi:trace amine-associated receptor 13c-like [Pygocentrus nattereri]|uniref:G-protein coupled receptors family 1 profile domain-containing protein n=1 Tax=Pygocentrus nattereri TaxID=42514 RepID=A0AAR2KA18_PYGNA|nr:trace amine-associated receptor 13c-like [Pygocentrus nattereri]